MQLNRLRAGEALGATGAVVLLVSLFFDWFEPQKGVAFHVDGGTANIAGYVNGLTKTGFNGLGWLLVLLLLLAVVAALTVAALTVTLEPVGLTVTSAVIATAVGIIATIALAVRLGLGQPDLGAGLQDAQVHVMTAAYIGLAGCAAVAAGGWLSMADERTDAPYSAAPELPARPIPPAPSP